MGPKGRAMTHEGDPLEPEDLMIRLVRSAGPPDRGDAGRPTHETLAAYVMGVADEPQREEVQRFLVRNPGLRREILELVESCRGLSTGEAQRAFDRAVVPQLERDPRFTALEASLERRARPAPPRLSPQRERRGRWLEWALGGWAGAATVAASILLVSVLRNPVAPPESSGRRPLGAQGGAIPPQSASPAGPGGAPSGGAPAASPEPPAVLALLPEVTREGLEGPVVEVFLAEGTDLASVPLPDLRAVQTGAQVRLEIFAPDGGLLVARRVTPEELARSSALAFGRPGIALRPGRYQLLIVTYSSGPGRASPIDSTRVTLHLRRP